MGLNNDNLIDGDKVINLSDLVVQKAKAGLRAEASRGYLGVLWWIIEPVMYMTVFYIAFARLMNRGDDNFVVFLLTGLIVWKWFASTLNTGANSLMVNANLMNQVYVPKIVFPLVNISVNTFKFLIILILLLFFLQFTTVKATWTWLFLPILVFIQLFFVVATTSLFSAILPFFPDLKVILDNVLMMFLFLSGIFYDISKMPTELQNYLMLNPMAVLILMYRNVLLKGITPNWYYVFMIFMISLILLFISILIFRRFDRIYPKIVF